MSLTVGGDNTSTAFSGVISGTGALSKTGTGTLTLSGNNTYTGGTTLNGGTLGIGHSNALGTGGLTIQSGGLDYANAISMANAIALSNSTTVNVASGTATQAGAISGTGFGLTKTGAGTLVLSGANSFTGATTIAGGTLSTTAANALSATAALTVAAGATWSTGSGNQTIGSLAGAGAVQTGAMILTAGDDNTSTAFTGSISGSGALKKTGTGTLALSGNNTYSGGTTLDGGGLRIDNSNALGTGGLTIQRGNLDYASAVSVANAIALSASTTLNVDSGSATQSGAIGGTGFGITKTGAGTLVLSGANTYTGSTVISGGTLQAASANVLSSATAVDIGAGTTFDLGGFNQTSGSLTNAGTMLLGSNTYAVSGDVTFMAGSNVSLAATTAQSGKIVATGAATLGGTVRVQAGRMASSTSTILQASAIYGKFDTITSNYAFLDAALDYTPTDVTLTLKPNGKALVAAATTANQKSVAASLQTLGEKNPLYQAILYLDLAGVGQAFDLLSGESFSTLQGSLVSGTQSVNSLVMSRLAQGSGASFGGPMTMQVSGGSAMAYADDTNDRPTFASRWPFNNEPTVAVWGQGFGNWTHTYGTEDTAEARSSTGGVITGYDVTVDRTWRYGLAAGADRTWMSSSARLSNATADSYHIAAYGGMQGNGYAVRVGAAFTWNDIKSNRTVAFSGFNESLQAHYQSMSTQAFTELSTRLSAGDATVEPYAGLSYVNTYTPGYSESGGDAALTASRSSQNTGFTTLGARAALPLYLGDEALTLRSSLGWRHAFGQLAANTQLAFGGSSPFNVAGAPIVGDTFLYDAGLAWALTDTTSIDVSYAGERSTAANSNTVRGTFTYRY